MTWSVPLLTASLYILTVLATSETEVPDGMRVEHDTHGTVLVPEHALWAAQTQRSLQNFKISEDRIPKRMIRALLLLKQSAAEANARALGPEISSAIARAAQEVLSSEDLLETQFPLVVFQTGSGTQTNMNVNEVLASVANRILAKEEGRKGAGGQKVVHPNDHVNRGQSTNDAFSAAMHIAIVLALREQLLPALKTLFGELDKKVAEFGDVIKMGRTHMQDATPLTVGQEFSAWAAQVKWNVLSVQRVLPRLYHLVQGGTAVGTGLNTDAGFDQRFVDALRKNTGIPEWQVAENKFEGIAAHDALVEVAGVQNTVASSMMKIANDFRLLSSGPVGGLGELILPANEPGSSIMPGKVNPTQAEALSMVAAQVMGNAVAVSVANSHGHLQLQVFKPVIIANLLHSSRLLADAAASFALNCVAGTELNRARVADLLARNLMLATALNPLIGYEKAADVAKTALKEQKTLRQVAVEDRGYLSPEAFDAAVRPEKMIQPRDEL
mmetsp:Transcript_122526/g.357786  ORF Transcript_122526/g.357786 Transcript_122526/m.357786 type:complete len:499 (+) Transcript_122526:119-1615(+)